MHTNSPVAAAAVAANDPYAPKPAPARGEPHTQLLVTLLRTGPVREADIPARWPLVRMHIPVVIDRLIAHGFVTRDDAPDDTGRRQRVVALTAAGRRAAELARGCPQR